MTREELCDYLINVAMTYPVNSEFGQALVQAAGMLEKDGGCGKEDDNVLRR